MVAKLDWFWCDFPRPGDPAGLERPHPSSPDAGAGARASRRLNGSSALLSPLLASFGAAPAREDPGDPESWAWDGFPLSEAATPHTLVRRGAAGGGGGRGAGAGEGPSAAGAGGIGERGSQAWAQRYPWRERRGRREALLRPKLLYVQRSDLASLCAIVWASTEARHVDELFGPGAGAGAGAGAGGHAFDGADDGWRDGSIDRKRFGEYMAEHVKRMESDARLSEAEVAELWAAVDHDRTGRVGLDDFGALLHPEEAARLQHCRAKLLRGERKCAVGQAGQVHVSALARQGGTLPLLSPSRRARARADAGAGADAGAASARGAEEAFERAKGMPRGAVKRALFVALQAAPSHAIGPQYAIGTQYDAFPRR